MSNIKVIIKKSKTPGKKILVLAGVHGNEVCGLKIVEELIYELKINVGSIMRTSFAL